MSSPIDNRPEYSTSLQQVLTCLEDAQDQSSPQLSKESLVCQQVYEQVHEQQQEKNQINDLSSLIGKIQLSVPGDEKLPNSPRGGLIKVKKVNALLGNEGIKPYINFIQSLASNELNASAVAINYTDIVPKITKKIFDKVRPNVSEQKNFFAIALKEFSHDEHCAAFLVLKEFLDNKNLTAAVGIEEIAYQAVCLVLNDTAKDDPKLLESCLLGTEYKAIIADRDAFSAFISFISHPSLSPCEANILGKICQYQKSCDLFNLFNKSDLSKVNSKSPCYNAREFLFRSILDDVSKENGVNISNEKKKVLLSNSKIKEHGVDRFSEIVDVLFEDLIPNYLTPAAPNPKHPIFSSSLQYYRMIIAKKLPFTVPLSLD